MTTKPFNKFRAAAEILQRGRDQIVEEIADEVLDRADDLFEAPFLFHEFLENQGTRLHFLSLLTGQLEQSAETLEEQHLMELQLQEAAAKAAAAALTEPAAPKRASRARTTAKKDPARPAQSQRKRNTEES
jgi:hypothetical protein